MRLNHSIKLAISIAITTALLVGCSGGSDAAAPAETTATDEGTTSAPTDTTATTPATALEPTTGYGYVTKPAGGNYGIQCAKDYATGLIWEGKNPNPAHPQGIGRTYTNFDSTTALQIEFVIVGRPSVYSAPTISQINAANNSIGYKNAINAIALCGFTDWRLPTNAELATLGLLSSKLVDFPEASSGAYWSNNSGYDRDSTGSVLRPPDTGGNKEYRGNFFGVRLVRSSR